MLSDQFGKRDNYNKQILNNFEQVVASQSPTVEVDPLAQFPVQVKSAIERLHNSSFSSVEEEFRDCSLITDYFEKQISKSFGPTGGSNLINPGDMSNYDSAGSVLRRLFPNPFQLHGFLADNYYVASKCRHELSKETWRDGFSLVANDKISKREIKQCYEVLKKMGIEKKRDRMRDNIAWCGNTLQKKERNKAGGITDVKLYLMPQLQPIFKPYKDEIEGWLYFINTPTTEVIPADEVDLLFQPCARSQVIGQPTMNPLVVLIEAALHSNVYQNTMMQKGGLMRGLFTMEKLSNDKEIINDKTYMELAETLTKYFEKRFGGVRGAGSLGFAPFVKQFIDLSNIKDLDGAWTTLNKHIALACCAVFGVPPERLNLERGSQYKNQAEIFDSVSLSFDNELYYQLGIVDNYWNEVLEEMGFNCRIEVDGEFSSISTSAAEFGYKISQMGKSIMTVNQFRVKVLKWAPLDGPEGDEFIGKIDTPTAVAKAIGPANLIPKKYEEGSVIRHKFNNIAYY